MLDWGLDQVCLQCIFRVVIYHITLGCTPLKTVPILFCVKAWSKNCHSRVLIMISISQKYAFQKDYIHTHQMGSHFLGADLDLLDFLRTEQVD